MSAVKLYVYDLSHGMARSMSMAFIGRQIEAIWHTSVVAFGREYYFGQGIADSPPGQSPHGHPMEIVDMGETMLPKDVFLEYLENLRTVYTPDKYHLLENNCNHFSNEVCQFLVGREIPSHITDLPKEFANTPFGQALRPMIDSMFNVRSQPHFASGPAAVQPQPSAPESPVSVVRDIQSLDELRRLISSSKAVIIDFTSQNCPPCRLISPEYKRLASELQVIPKGAWMGGTPGLLALQVDTSLSFQISQAFNVTATPTFITFLNGNKFEEMKGANAAGLKSLIQSLMWSAYPPHPHSRLDFKSPVASSFEVISFTAGQSSAIVNKLQQFLADSAISLSDEQKHILQSIQQCIDDKAKPINEAMLKLLYELLKQLPVDRIFSVLDLLRLLSARLDFANLIEKDTNYTILRIIHDFGTAKNAQSKNVPPSAVLITLRLVCNMFLHPVSASYLLSDRDKVPGFDDPTTHIMPWNTLVTALLSHILKDSSHYSDRYADDKNIRQVVGSLVYNLAAHTSHNRRQVRGLLNEKQQQHKSDSLSNNEDENVEPEYVVEITSALLHSIQSEFEHIQKDGDETAYRLLVALLHFLYLGSDVLLDLAVVMEAESATHPYEQLGSSRLNQVCQDILSILKQHKK